MHKDSPENVHLNKISTRHYWGHFLAQKIIPSALFCIEPIGLKEKMSLFKEYVCIVNIETSTYCNRVCAYCPVSLSDSRKKQTHMADAIFQSILEQLASIDYASTISFNLYNEPLADADIFQRVETARKRLPHSFLMFNSNGDYINRDDLNELSKIGLNALLVTLHPPVDKQYLYDDRLKAFQQFFVKLGRDVPVVKKVPDENHLEADIDWNGMQLRVMAHYWEKLGNSRAGAVRSLNMPEARTSPCVRPLREFTISYDGNVWPCCQFFPDDAANKKYIVDNLGSKSIFEIYASAILTKWRKDLFSFGKKNTPCDSCRDEDFSTGASAEIRKAILHKLETQRSK